jgi:DNA-binding NarL/FixJ family response regulator
VLLVDDHRHVRVALEQLFEQVPEIVVVGSTWVGKRALQLVPSARPDVVLMDLSMPDMDGIEATRAIQAAFPEVRVLVFTAYSDPERVLGALDAGAVGYLLKDAEPDELVTAIQAAARGECWLSARVESVVRAFCSGD